MPKTLRELLEEKDNSVEELSKDLISVTVTFEFGVDKNGEKKTVVTKIEDEALLRAMNGAVTIDEMLFDLAQELK